MTAAELLTKVLQKHGVSVIFGYPGAAICPFFDSVSKSDIRLVTVRQEQMAGHAASGYARTSGRVGVCAATSGPGALNLLPAVATAYMDSIPLVIITGQVSSELLGRDVFQEADITGAAEPFVKHSYLVKSATTLPYIIAEAFYIAATGRKGPVLIDIPEDILRATLDEKLIEAAHCDSKTGYIPFPPIDMDMLKNAARLINIAAKPLICIGGGVFGGNARDEVKAFISQTNIPFVSTMMGLSALSPMLPQSAGRIGMYGDSEANQALKDCDLLLLCGARVGDRAIMSPLGLSKTTAIIHIDIDAAELNKNMITDVPIVGDIKKAIPLLQGLLKRDKFKNWIEKKEPISHSTNEESKDYVSPARLMETVCSLAETDAILAVDVGQHLIWAARGYALEHGRFLASGGMGTMGYSLPAGIGAAIAAPTRQVIVLCGDGGFQMNFCELATMMQEKLPLKLIVFQNHGLGLVRELQNKWYKNNVSVNLCGDPDFAIIGAAYGIEVFHAKTDLSLKENVHAWLCTDQPAILICEISPSEKA